MSIMTKIFGQNASGENGLSIFSRHVAAATKNEFKRTQLWEIGLAAGMGLVFGAFLGAGVAAGIMYAKDGSPIVKQDSTQEEQAAPGVIPGSAAGAAALLYYFYLHNGVSESWRETRRQIADNRQPPTPQL